MDSTIDIITAQRRVRQARQVALLGTVDEHTTILKFHKISSLTDTAEAHRTLLAAQQCIPIAESRLSRGTGDTESWFQMSPEANR